tara:strand:- start:5632 stop:6771 length:1140 start_codon:yes stop_codon:yes gene_type:complete
MYRLSKNIQKSLLKKLYNTRTKIKIDNDIYLDKEHEKLCEYYNKYVELSKKFSSSKTIKEYKSIKIDKHLLSDSHDEDDKIIYKEHKITFDLLYNEYNKKFINRIYVLHNDLYYNEWINEQNKFIKNLNSKDIYTLRCHTHDANLIINYFINNNLNIDKDIDEIGMDSEPYRKSEIVVSKKIFNSNRDYILFYYQIKEYLYNSDNKSLLKLNRLELEDYIINNYHNFNWNDILLLYIRDINNIFDKCPLLKNTLILYRGVYDDYYNKNSIKGYHLSKTLNSFTLNYKTAITYGGINCCVMRVKIPISYKIILIDILSPYNEEEVLLPFNTRYYIDYPRHIINYYRNTEICPDTNKSKKIMVSDLSVISKSIYKSKSKSQ